MAGQNQFFPFATAPGANVLTPSTWSAATGRQTGAVPGLAKSVEANTAWRQSTVIAAMIGDFIAQRGYDALDNADLTALRANFEAALGAQFSASLVHYVVDVGTTANTLVLADITPDVPTIANGMAFVIVPATTNTGPVNAVVTQQGGTVSVPVITRAAAALGSGDIVAGRPFIAVFYAGSLRIQVMLSSELAASTEITNIVTNIVTNNFAKGSLIARRIYNTPGTYTYSPSDSKVRAIRVIVQGAGGAGGATQATGSGSFAAAGGGGGGGTAISDLLLATAGVNGATITVGSGGAANGNWATPGGNGGSSSFGAFLSATGGAGGAGGQSNGLANVQAGGNKGFGVGGNFLNLEGGPGQYSTSFSQFNFCSGAGGSSYFGGGAVPIYPASGNGLTPTTAGGGGSGAGFTQNSGAGVGGNGANGIVLVEEFA